MGPERNENDSQSGVGRNPDRGIDAGGQYPTPILKATRAYIAGLGTSGVLIASFLLLLAVVSAIVAFRGFPGEASNDGLGRLDVSDARQASSSGAAERSGADAARRKSARGDRGSARGARRGARGSGRGADSAGGARDAGGRRAGGERAAGGLAGGGAGGGPAPAGGSGSGNLDGSQPVEPRRRPGGVPAAPGVGDVAGGLGGAVEQTSGGLGGAAGSVAPPLEAPVRDAGETAAGVVEQAAPVVDGAVGGVSDTAGGVSEAVEGATGPVSGVTGGLP